MFIKTAVVRNVIFSVAISFVLRQNLKKKTISYGLLSVMRIIIKDFKDKKI